MPDEIVGGAGAVVDENLGCPGCVVVGDVVFVCPAVVVVQEAVLFEHVQVRDGILEFCREGGAVLLGGIGFDCGLGGYRLEVGELAFVGDEFFGRELVGLGQKDVDLSTRSRRRIFMRS